MMTFRLWLLRFYILAFLLFAWHIAPFTRFAPLFPVAWSLTVVCTAFAIPARTGLHGEQPAGAMAVQGLLVGLLLGLSCGAVDWSVLDLTLLFQFCWAWMPLFLFDRFLVWAWNQRRRSTGHRTLHVP